MHYCYQSNTADLALYRSIEKLPGHPNLSVMKGAPVISAYQERHLVTVFPVHDTEELGKLRAYWRSSKALSPPLDQIRNYFGESVALYWSFAESYTKLLILITVFGIIEWICESQFHLFESITLF